MKTSPAHPSPSHAARPLFPLAALPLAALLLASPAGAQALPGAVALDASRPPPQTVMAYPLPAGRVEAAVARIDGIVADLMRRTGVPGVAVAVVHEGRPLLVKGYGVRKVGEAAPVDADTVFQLASLSKAVGAGVVAHEVARGTVKWDTPVEKILPWFTLKDPWVGAHVTIGDLYSHRSGLPDHAGDELEDMGYDRRQVMERLRELPLAPFRASYAYTNFGLTSAAEAVAQAAGTDWQSLSEERLYKPLGMAATSSRFADFMGRPNRAIPHVRESGLREGAAFVAKYQRDPAAQSPAGGVSSSAHDMALWLGFVLGGAQDQALAKALLPAMRPQTISSPAYAVDARSGFYGFGFGAGVSPSGRVMLDHSGAFMLGAATNFSLLPTDRLGIVTLTNAQPVGLAEAISMSFMDLVQFGEVTRDWLPAYQALMAPMYTPLGTLAGKAPPANPAPAQPLAAYEGTYGNAYFGDAAVRVESGALVLSVGPRPRRFTLAHWSGDTFVFRPEGLETAPPGSVSQVTFADGRMRVEFLDDNGLGTFVKR